MKRVFLSTRTPFGDIYRIRYPRSQALLDALNLLASDESVEWVEPNYKIFTSATPNDYNPIQQWGLAKIQADLSWDISHGDPDVVIAIVDTGVDYSHQDLSDNIWHNPGEIPGNSHDDDNNGFVDDDIGWDFVSATSGGAPGEDMGPRDRDPMDFHGHGTHCSGIASAVTDNGVGIAGTAWSCSIMAVRAGYTTLSGRGVLESVDAAAAIEYAANNGADVISMSWGGSNIVSIIRTAIQHAYSRGCVLVAAAGNSGVSSLHYPAGYNEVIAVAASDQSDSKAYFSNYGNWVDIAAPGVSIYSTLPNNSYDSWNGTSMATPFVSGVSALLLSEDSTMTSEEVRQRLVNSGDDINWGFGPYKRLNAFRALGYGNYFTVYNDGSRDLNVTDITIENGSQWLSTDFSEPFTVHPGGSEVILVSLDTAGLPGGDYTDRILVYSNDPDENPAPVSVNLSITNTPPHIVSITADPNPVGEDGISTISSVAIDDDGHDLTHEWSVTQGSITGSGPVVTYNPPDVSETTSVTITLTVSDGYGGSDTGTEIIEVFPTPETITLDIHTGWNLISCPGDPVITSFTDLLTGTDVLPYALTWDANAAQYVSTDLFEFSKAYWWAATGDTQIPVEYVPRTTFTMPVKTSWNMIGSVDGSVPADSMTTVPPNSVLPYVLAWDAAAARYINPPDIVPGCGHWIAAIQDATLTVSYPPPVPTSEPTARISEPLWQGVITVEGNGSVQELGFGVHPEALDGADMMDRPIPPGIDNDATFDAYFVGDDTFKMLSEDIKQEAGAKSWELKVRSDKGGTKLTWDITGVPPDVSLTLTGSGGRKTDMHKENSMTLPKGEHRLTLEASAMTVRDVTDMVAIDRTDAASDGKRFSMKVSITNVSETVLHEPLHLVMVNLTPSSVSVQNADGMTPEGAPYVDLSGLVKDGKLEPGEVSKSGKVMFSNPEEVKFSFDLRCMAIVSGGAMAAPSVPGRPMAERYDALHVVVPVKSRLLQNYPNPFNPETWIPFELAESCEVKVNIYDVQGRLIRALHLGYRQIGEYVNRDDTAHWDGRNESGEKVTSGIYFYVLQTDSFIAARKMIVVN